MVFIYLKFWNYSNKELLSFVSEDWKSKTSKMNTLQNNTSKSYKHISYTYFSFFVLSILLIPVFLLMLNFMFSPSRQIQLVRSDNVSRRIVTQTMSGRRRVPGRRRPYGIPGRRATEIQGRAPQQYFSPSFLFCPF